MQPVVTSVFGGVLVISGMVGAAWAHRAAERRGRADNFFAYAWTTVAVWFGLLPLIDGARLPATVQDLAYAVVVAGGIAVTLWCVFCGVRARRAEFRAHQLERRADGEPTSRYFWSPWSIFGWTLGLGFVVVFGIGIAIGSTVGVLLDQATADDVESIAKNLANVISACAFALVPLAAAAGAWRWWSIHREGRQQFAEPPKDNVAQPEVGYYQ